MKESGFTRIIREELGAPLRKRNFEYEKNTFFRELPSSVIHLIGLEFDPHVTDTFRVICGANTRRIEFYAQMPPRGLAFIGGQHLTPSGFDINSGHWPCANEREARTSLIEVLELIPAFVEPWFETHQTLSSVAAEMDTQHPRQGLDKAKLFLADDNLPKAVDTLQQFLQRLDSPKPWDDPKELANLKSQAEVLLKEISMNAH